ncbi:hypothetical protein [Tenacibaculum sp. 190130A14a]|uniref:DUF2158 domain-containing protein n=1 Tax=Tenacibaculum polynesiense TaxID=3137857 RepID=A0ABP1F4F0_9FLAO
MKIQTGDVVTLKSDSSNQKFTVGAMKTPTSCIIYWFHPGTLEMKSININIKCLKKYNS